MDRIAHAPCPDCGRSIDAHLTADEVADHDIDPGLRDGLGCAVIARVTNPVTVSIYLRNTDGVALDLILSREAAAALVASPILSFAGAEVEAYSLMGEDEVVLIPSWGQRGPQTQDEYDL